MLRRASSQLIMRQVVRRGTDKTGDVLSHCENEVLFAISGGRAENCHRQEPILASTDHRFHARPTDSAVCEAASKNFHA